MRLPEITEDNVEAITALRETFIREEGYLKQILQRCPVECQDKALNWRWVFDSPEEIDALLIHLRGPVRRQEAIMATRMKHAGPNSPIDGL